MKNPYQRKTVSKNQQKPYSVLENYQQFIQNIIAQRMIIALYHEGWYLRNAFRSAGISRLAK